MRTHLGLLVLFSLLAGGCAELLQKMAAKPDKGLGDDEGQLGPVNQASVGQIRFAHASIPRATPDGQAFVTSVSLDEPIWTRAYLASSPHRMVASAGSACGDEGALKVYAAVDGGEERVLGGSFVSGEAWNRATTGQVYSDDLPLVAEKVVLPGNERKAGFAAMLLLASLGDGEHQLTLRLTGSCTNGDGETPLAQGSVVVRVTPQARLALARRISLNAANLPGELPRLEPIVRETFAGEELLHLRILDDAWQVERGPEGEPLRRFVTTYAILRKDKTCRALGFMLVEESEGGGRYGQTVARNFTYEPRLDPVAVPCELAQVASE